MLKTYPFRCRPAEKSFQVQFSHRLITNEHCQLRPVVYPLFSIFNSQFSQFKTMSYLFTSESVSEGHPDKVADQISDALLDEFLAYDKNSKVACETLVTTGQVVLAGEVKSSAYVDVQEVARGVIEKIGYTKSEYQFEAKSCGVFSSIHEAEWRHQPWRRACGSL